MDLLKALKRTTIISAMAVSAAALLAFSATEARADAVAAEGHMSASVQGTLAISETSAMNFGNFSLGGDCATSCAGDATLVLSDSGSRSVSGTSDTITLLYGASSSPAGITSGTDKETGAQRPGFFAISGATSGASVYISFADSTGAIIDSSYDPGIHPGNYVTLGGPVAGAFTVDSFTFETDAGSGTEGTGGYTQQSGHTTDVYGSYVTLTGTTATLRVGGTLHTVSGKKPTAGHYTGTYYVMASY